MTKKVQFVTGLLSALVFPVLTVLVFKLVLKNIALTEKPLTPYLVSIAFNLLLLRYFVKSKNTEAAYAVIAVTFIFMLILFIFKP